MICNLCGVDVCASDLERYADRWMCGMCVKRLRKVNKVVNG